MICNGLFTTELCNAINIDDDLELNISHILKMVEYSKTHNTTYFTHEDTLYGACINDIDFASWLYDYSNPSLRDIKKEISIEISRSQTLSDDFDLDAFKKEETTFIVGISENFTIKNIFEYLQFKQNRLKHISAKSSFGVELQECYYYIYFDDSVPSTLNTLNNTFVSIRNDIISHLQSLDKFCRLHPERLTSGYSNECFSREFKEFSGIECSPQSSRDSISNLTRRYVNSLTQEKEDLTCELHTKFSIHNREATKQDRIYFHKGRANIFDGKLIVIHIGDHQ